MFLLFVFYYNIIFNLVNQLQKYKYVNKLKAGQMGLSTFIVHDSIIWPWKYH